MATNDIIMTYTSGQFTLEDLAESKGDLVLSVLIPARNEAGTIAQIINTIKSNLMDDINFVDELIVINDASQDNTSDIAKNAGAFVIDIPGDMDHPIGKGAALREGVKYTRGDLLLFLDGDVWNFSEHFVTSMFGPLLCNRQTVLCKPKYQRLNNGVSFGGGRVTELVAKPALELLLPELSAIEQPLAGESAIRREILEKLVLEDNYKIEVALLIDVYHSYGIDAIAQVDLGERYHKSRELAELIPTARDVLEAIFARVSLR